MWERWTTPSWERAVCSDGCLPGRRGEMTASLKIGGAGGRVVPCHSGGVRMGRLFISEQTPLAQICPWPIHSSPLSRPPHPGAWCPIHDLRGGKRPCSSGSRCGGQRGRGLGGPRVAPCGPTAPQLGEVVADFAWQPPGAPRTRRPQPGLGRTAGPRPAGRKQRVGAGIPGWALGCF